MSTFSHDISVSKALSCSNKSNFLAPLISVVGCSGFIGSHLTSSLLREGVRVRGLDLESSRVEHLRSLPGFEFRQGNYIDPENLQWLTAGGVPVIHLAALCNPSLYNTQSLRTIQSNYTAPLAIVEACARGGNWLLHFSTSEVYGRTKFNEWTGPSIESAEQNLPEACLSEDDSPLLLGPVQASRWCYASAKQLLERTILAWDQELSFPWTIIRPFNFIGPGMDYIPGVDGEGVPRVVACFMNALLRGEPMLLVEGGKNRRCFTWIGDAVDAVVKILQNPTIAQRQIFNVGNPANEVNIHQLALLMGKIFAELQNQNISLPPKIRTVSAEEFYGLGYQDSDRRIPQMQKVHSLLKWEPKVNLQDALRLTVQWFNDNYAKQIQAGG